MTDVLSPAGLQLSAELAESHPGAITFNVHGKAATKGSSVSFADQHTGRIVTKPMSNRLRHWTLDAKWSAIQARVKKVPKPRGVCVRVWFLFERPTSVTVIDRPLMTVMPDIDKCLRAALDALTGIAYDDDSQVVDVQMRKRYSDRNESYIQIWEVR